MMLFRSALFSVFMIVYTMLFATSAVFLRPFPFRIMSGFLRFYAVMVIYTLRLFCGVHFTIEGRENIPAEPIIIFSKHQSTWETYALQIIFRQICYVVKRELFWIPFFGWGLAAMRPIAIDRSSGATAVQQIVIKGKTRLQQGISVVIFPEGTRTAPNKSGKYKMGGAVFASQSGGYKVVPVAHNAGECWSRGGFIKRPGLIQVRIGPAIDTQGKSPEQIQSEARGWIEAQMPQISKSYLAD